MKFNSFKPFVFTLIVLCAMTFSCSAFQGEDPRVLIFSKVAGFQHKAIPQSVGVVMALGTENGIKVDTTTNAALFTEENLKEYNAVVFLNTTGDVLNNMQEKAFEKYIQGGGGFVGIHSATDTEYDWEWYGKLVGAYFSDHPEVQEAVLEVQDQNHPSTAHLPATWVRTDEWYNFRNFNEDVKVLITVDENTYDGGSNGNPHPVAWYHQYDGGRGFYTALGHYPEYYREPLFLKHLLGGIRYAIGE